MDMIRKKRNEKNGWNRKYWYVMTGICGFLAMLQGKAASADLIDAGAEMRYSNAPGPPWMETAIIAIVGLMVILAIGAILYLHYQKKQDAQERMQREEAEREEQ